MKERAAEQESSSTQQHVVERRATADVDDLGRRPRHAAVDNTPPPRLREVDDGVGETKQK